MIPEWLNVIELLWLVGACYACFIWGKNKGVEETVTLLIEQEILTEKDLKKLGDLED